MSAVELEAANERIKYLELRLEDARKDADFFEDRMAMHGALDRKRIADLERDKEDAARKLALVHQQLIEVMADCLTGSLDNIPARIVNTLNQIEQPQEIPQ